MEARFIVGAMSGTSADGVDAALVRVDGHGLAMQAVLVSHRHIPYDPQVRQTLFAMRSAGRADLATLALLGRQITLHYADAVCAVLASANVPAAEVAAIAAHGQTLFHEPPLTVQWFDPSLLAWETGCAVVSDFRRADCAAGGQGAPLVPFADYILFRHPSRTRILLNIGGIANLTFIRPGCAVSDVIAMDCGPGNCISDYLCRSFDPAGPGFDAGQRAMAGVGNPAIAAHMLAHPWFRQSAPKSTDGPAMIRIWEDSLEQIFGGLPGYAALSASEQANLLASACHVTAVAILKAIEPFSLSAAVPIEVLASGGGVHNRAILSHLKQHELPRCTITTDGLGFPGEAKEAVAFALLGAATLDGVPSNLPSVTGARRAVVLGSITPRP